MFANVSSVILYVFLAIALLVLPGFVLLRLTISPPILGFVSRLVISPGITIALTVLVFTWCDLCGLKPGPALPWVLIVGSVLILLFVRLRRSHLQFRFAPISAQGANDPLLSRLRRIPPGEWLAGIALATTLALFFAVRFRATWGWCVPPGIDTEQHTMIVQLLIDHRGLFQSWAPYSDAETFTYHFGFHAITAVFGWLTRLDAVNSVYIMARVIGAVAAASLFALVRLWTRSAWGGVFAVAFWEISSKYLFPFEALGRWTLLTGLTTLTSGLVLLSLHARARSLLKQVPLGLLCAVTAGGIVLTQYKTAIIFTVLAATLFATRCLNQMINHPDGRFRRVLQITCRMSAVAGIALVLAAPRLHTIMEARAGRYLKRIVLEAPAATSNQFDRPTLTGFGILRFGFETPRKALVSALAAVAVFLVALRRRQALWFVIGWTVVTLLMNPSLVGSRRLGLIDEMHWKLAVESAIAVMGGLTIGLITEALGKAQSILRNGLAAVVVGFVTLGGARALTPVPNSSRYVLPEDVRLMKWIARNVPNDDLIAGRGYLEHGEILGRDAMMWLPHFTRHRTNHTNLAAGLEKGPADQRQKLRDFTRELYARDMALPESARWMQEQGFRWFYAGAMEPERDSGLLAQLERNPGLETVRAEGGARLYRVR